MFEAARVNDPIAHTSALAGFLAGAMIGIALIAAVAFVTFTGGCGLAIVAGLIAGIAAGAAAPMLASLGESIGGSFTSPSGMIKSGSPNVFVNGRQAAHATASATACSKHTPVPLVAEGSTNVFINGLPASRKKDAVTCGAIIDDGSPNVFIGGGTERYLDVDEEIPAELRTGVDGAFMLAGLLGGAGGLVKAAGGKLTRALLPCLAKYAASFAVGEVVGRYVIEPVVKRVVSGLYANPVDVTTGRKILLSDEEIDFVVHSAMPVIGCRFYGSNLTHEGSLGKGWVLPWDLRLQQRNGQLWFTDGQGRETGYPMVQAGQNTFSEAEQTYLACSVDGQYILYSLDELYYDFGKIDVTGDDIAWVRRMEDRTGQWHAYDRDENGLVRTLRTSSGQQLALHYSRAAAPRLSAIACTSGGSPGELVRYRYSALGQLASVTDANGAVVRRFDYTDGLMSSHTNALGFVCSYTWAQIEGAPRVSSCRTSEGEHTVFRYDPAQRQSWATDELGRTAHWVYDEHFQIVECTDLDNGHYRIKYTDAGMPAIITLPGERAVVLEYDAAARMISETDPLGRITRTTYDANSLRIGELLLPNGSRWRSEYDSLGRLLKTTDPLGRHEQYEYAQGPSPLPLVHIDARGGRKYMSWDNRGQMRTYTDCSGKVTSYAYDADGNLASVTDALGQTTQYQRTRTGAPVKVIHTDGSTEEFTYDPAGLLIEQRNSAQQTRRWERNARGQVTAAIDPVQRHLHYRYDERGRLVELATATNTRYGFEYDSGDRLARETRPDGVEEQMRYDAAGALLAIDKSGALPNQAAADRPRRTTFYRRDKLGRILGQETQTATTTYAWDDGDNLVEVEQLPTEAGTALGLVASAIRFEYDKAGRLLAEHGREGMVGYVYDELANLTTLTLPHGQRIDTLHYGSGHVHQIRTADQIISDFERDDLHREVLHTQGDLTQRIGYDALGRRSWQASGSRREPMGPGQGRLWRNYRYTTAGELADQRDNIRGTIDFQYSAAGQLKRQTRTIDHQQESFAWDAANNLLEDTGQKSAGNISGNRLLVWQDLRFEYDAWGNLKTKRKGAHQIQNFNFDAEDRLIRVSTENLHGTRETRFEYDPLGRRIASIESDVSTSMSRQTVMKRFVWQGLRMVQEIRESSVSSYVYSPDQEYAPLARVDAVIAAATANAAIETAKSASRMYYFHTDLVGTPLEVTDELGDLAWTGKYRAWGKVEQGEDGTASARIDQPLRYAGQYADQGSGLHYNTFRFYDPDIGRFISQDPIGLAGGSNLYAYTPNPTRWIDPWGLNCTTPNKKTSYQAKSRRDALRQAKRDAGIPNNQRPKIKRTDLDDGYGNKILDRFGNPVQAREYVFRKDNGEIIIIQEHSYGHPKATPGHGIEPHINVRPEGGERTGSVPGTHGHYNY